MARSVFYYYSKKSEQKDKYALEKKEIMVIFNENQGRYGYRRITAEMKNRGYRINHKTVQKLMQQSGLRSRKPKVKYRSYKGQTGRTAPNILCRNFNADTLNSKWVTDVTQINIGSEKLYLSPIIDLFNGEVISYNISKSPNLKQIWNMPDKAFRRFSNLEGLIIHSDQGWQYQHREYRTRLEKKGIIQSMSRKGNCLDNAMAENFFGRMKTELLYTKNFKSSQAFIKALKEYIDYYNNRRIKLKLNGMSPIQYRNMFSNKIS